MSELKGLVLGFGGWANAWQPLNDSVPAEIKHLSPVEFTICMCAALGAGSLMVAGTVESIPNYQKILGDGEKFGLKISYLLMHSDENTAQAVLSAEEFLANAPVLVASAGLCCYGPDLKKFVSVQRDVVNFSFGCESPKSSFPPCEMFYLGKSGFAAARQAVEQHGAAANRGDLMRCFASEASTRNITSFPGVYCVNFNKQQSSCCNFQTLVGDRLDLLAQLMNLPSRA